MQDLTVALDCPICGTEVKLNLTGFKTSLCSCGYIHYLKEDKYAGVLHYMHTPLVRIPFRTEEDAK